MKPRRSISDSRSYKSLTNRMSVGALGTPDLERASCVSNVKPVAHREIKLQ